jgi:hypothetical protein
MMNGSSRNGHKESNQNISKVSFCDFCDLCDFQLCSTDARKQFDEPELNPNCVRFGFDSVFRNCSKGSVRFDENLERFVFGSGSRLYFKRFGSVRFDEVFERFGFESIEPEPFF